MDLTPSTPPLTGPNYASYFVWQPASGHVVIELSGDAVDQISLAVMRGVGAVPKRGAEVGGLLLGNVTRGERSVVRIEEFVNIPCEHLYGPSYILSETDLIGLDRELSERSADANASSCVVGFFRSNTRDQMELSELELALLDAHFPEDDAVCLLVRPFVTRPSEALFLVRENGRFSAGAQRDTFIFRRKEMNLGPAPRRPRPAPAPLAGPAAVGVQAPRPQRREPARMEAAPTEARRQEQASDPARHGQQQSLDLDSPPLPPDLSETSAVESGRLRATRMRSGREQHTIPIDKPAIPPAGARAARVQPPPAALPGPTAVAAPELPWDDPPGPARRSSRAWMPFPVIFLLLGVLLGAGSILTMNWAREGASSQDPYALKLGVSHFGDSYHLTWNPQMPAIRVATSGELLIQEGQTKNKQPLSADDLARGGIIYRGASEPVRFRLTLFLRDRSEFSESVETQAAPQ